MKNFSIIEYQGQRVLTAEQLAQAYECAAQQIKQNFNNNKKRFEEGKHYFKLEGYELKEFRKSCSENIDPQKLQVKDIDSQNLQVENIDPQISPMTRTLYLWTKRGASRHCKMLGTDKAWEMFDILEENYFNPKPAVTAAPYVLIPKFFRSKQVITIKDAAAILNTTTSFIDEIINKPSANIHEGKDYYRLKGDKRAEFKNENPSIPKVVHHIIAILKSGFEKICEYMKVYAPPIFQIENLETELGLETTPPLEEIKPKSELEQIREELLKAHMLVWKLYNICGDKFGEEMKKAFCAVADVLEMFSNEKTIYLKTAK